MNCVLSNTYNVPCRQLSGVNSLYLASNDPDFSVQNSQSLTGAYTTMYPGPAQPYPPEYPGCDEYTPGTYSYTLQYLSADQDEDLYTTFQGSDDYPLNGWTDANITIHFGPTVSIGYQSITCTITNIVNNYGLQGRIYWTLSGTTGINVLTNHNDSVVIAINISSGDTYQIASFGKSFFHFTQRLEQASYLESGVYSLESMTYNQKLEITLEGYDTTTLKILDVLNRSRVRAIIVDQNGNAYLAGNQNYLQAVTGEGGLGKSTTDGVKTTLSFEGKELLPALQLDLPTLISQGILIN